MARIPDVTDLSSRRVPRSAGGVVRNRAGEIFGRALEDAGDTIDRAQDRRRELDDRRQIAEAKRDIIVADSEISGELAADGDYATHEARYRKRMADARATAAQKIQRGDARELFLLDSDVDVARGVEALRKQVAVKDRAFRQQSLQNDIATITDAALKEPDEAKRATYLQTLNERLKVEQDAGTIDAADADAMRREASARYADAWLDSLPLREQVAVLEKGNGTPVEFLPEPLRLQRYEQAKARYKTEGTNDAGRALADALVAKHGYNFGAAVAEARKHEDTGVSDNAIARIKERQVYAEHQRDQAYEQAYDDALAWVNDGKPFEDMPEHIRRRLKPSVLNQFRKAATKTGMAGTADGDRLYSSLWTESQMAPEKFLGRDLADYHADLTQSQRDKIESRRERLMTGADDPEALTSAEKTDVNEWVKVVAGPRKTIGKAAEAWQTTADDFQRGYVERRMDFMRENGRPPNKEQRDQILRGMLTKVVRDGEATPIYRVRPDEYSALDLSGVVVPDATRQEIIKAIVRENVKRKRNGAKPLPLTDASITRLYLLDQGALRRPTEAE